MASFRFISLFFLIQFLCFTTTTTTLSSPVPVPSSSASSEKVNLTLYYETLCPFCSRFIVRNLSTIFDNGLIDIIDLKLVPYGNADVDNHGNITCQHGEYECLLNTVEACAINIWPNLNTHFTFISCVESLVIDGKYKEWDSCFGQLGLDPKPIRECVYGPYGKEIDLRYANDTNKLQPPHTYVPWVTVAGMPIYDSYQNFANYVCVSYKGPSLPKACLELPPPEIVPNEKSNRMLQVSYADEKSPTTKTKSQVPSRRRQLKMKINYE